MTVPYLRSNTGGSAASASSEVSRRMRLSSVTAGSYFGGTSTGQISEANRPASVAAAAFLWERYAIWSCSSREMWFSFAIFSADWPMVRPVEGSAIAGTSGVRSAGRTFANAASLSPRLRAREACMRIFVMRLLCRIGMSERLSAPPPIPTSA